MEFFEERQGLYISRRITGFGYKSPIVRAIVSLLPLLLIGGLFLGTSREGGSGFDNRLLIIMAGILFISNIVGLLARRFSTSGKIVVDQMQGNVTFSPIGGRRTSLSLVDLERITLAPVKVRSGKVSSGTRGRTWMVLGLENAAGENYRLIMQSDAHLLRMLADELSILTSAAVSENTCDT